ncbi:unnamed protein product [Didymodactylos carnosus]|uniref:F-box domain-containing protein n=1 Tax=Didymodactylos carnosus TaxID=1234261 RepID=A0A813V0B3_9BILA|nr:unnamed protein product [Didymodactylos carnosus]CAF1201243.1 unnamed protein product [Didymodactylos carnosus]CAF3617990.1 unnamed protein product [Didymodactylos carnosus]CAF4011135.1 unnamed protein product [Didymodactylos carnosus]
MPFLGRDWRANGEQWIKSDLGSWERQRSLSFSGSVVQLLSKEKLGELSGNAQSAVFKILKQMIDMVIKTGQNISIIQRILNQFRNSIRDSYPYFYYIGSEQCWRRNIHTLTRMQDALKEIEASLTKTNNEQDSSELPTLDCLPIEMQREIVRRLDNGNDIINVGLLNSNLYRVTKEILIWRELCLFHFGVNENIRERIMKLIQHNGDENNFDWKDVYFRLKRRYGHREVYAEMIHQCQICKGLYWQDSGHLCLYEMADKNPSSIPISPTKLVSLLAQ